MLLKSSHLYCSCVVEYFLLLLFPFSTTLFIICPLNSGSESPVTVVCVALSLSWEAHLINAVLRCQWSRGMQRRLPKTVSHWSHFLPVLSPGWGVLLLSVNIRVISEGAAVALPVSCLSQGGVIELAVCVCVWCCCRPQLCSLPAKRPLWFFYKADAWTGWVVINTGWWMTDRQASVLSPAFITSSFWLLLSFLLSFSSLCLVYSSHRCKQEMSRLDKVCWWFE